MLGAGHAFLPGHGKTIMAAYLVGKRGSFRDVVTVGATVTLTHTAGVLVLGVAITSSAAFAPAQAERWLGVVSGVIVALVGVGPAGQRPPAPTPVVAASSWPRSASWCTVGGHDHDHDHDHEHDHDHPTTTTTTTRTTTTTTPDDTPEAHSHGKGIFARSHSHDPAVKGFSKGGLVGLGVAGGLVPSPSALLVLLAATALGRTHFGVLLVLGYGVGMALALCAAGLMLVKLRGRLERLAGSTRLARAEKLLAVLPVFTALLVLAVGAPARGARTRWLGVRSRTALASAGIVVALVGGLFLSARCSARRPTEHRPAPTASAGRVDPLLEGDRRGAGDAGQQPQGLPHLGRPQHRLRPAGEGQR